MTRDPSSNLHQRLLGVQWLLCFPAARHYSNSGRSNTRSNTRSDPRSKTPLELALSHSHTDIANVIRQKKAENGSRDDGRISAWLQAIDMPQYIDVLLGCAHSIKRSKR